MFADIDIRKLKMDAKSKNYPMGKQLNKFQFKLFIRYEIRLYKLILLTFSYSWFRIINKIES